jgi:hypothetical protein
MSEEPNVTVWTPNKFDGSDLLPISASAGVAKVGEAGIPLVGRENIEESDLIVPSLRLMQPMSPQVAQGEAGAQPGIFYLSSTREFVKPPIRLLFIAHTKSNALFLPPQPDPRYTGLEQCLSRDGVTGSRYGACEECGKCTEWGPHGEKPLGRASNNFVVLTASGPALLRFTGASYKPGKEFVSNWHMGTKNLWDHPVVVTVKREAKELPSGASATFYVAIPSWQTSQHVPIEAQRFAYALQQQIAGASNSGRFGADDDDTTNIPF